MEQVAKMAFISFNINPQLKMNPYLVVKHFERKHVSNAVFSSRSERKIHY